MRKVLVIGAGGAGKTTLAKQIAERTGLPLIHLDQVFWSAGWIPSPDEAWDRTIAELVARASWVMDGNYGRTLEPRLAACDTVVFLDLPAPVCVWRVVKRRWQYRGRHRPDLPAGCDEALSLEFLRWIWTYRRRRRPGILARLAALRPHQRAVILRNSGDVQRFVAGLAAVSA